MFACTFLSLLIVWILYSSSTQHNTCVYDTLIPSGLGNLTVTYLAQKEYNKTDTAHRITKHLFDIYKTIQSSRYHSKHFFKFRLKFHPKIHLNLHFLHHCYTWTGHSEKLYIPDLKTFFKRIGSRKKV